MADKKTPLSAEPTGGSAHADHERTPFGQIEYRKHPSHTQVGLRGHSARELFQLAAWALARVQVERWDSEPTIDERIELEADGWDDLVVNWLNQLLTLSEKHRATWVDAEFEALDETTLRARVKGRAWPDRPDIPVREVKAAAYTGLEVLPGPSLWMARITIEF